MSSYSVSEKVVGLTTEKWAIYRLKQIQPKLKSVSVDLSISSLDEIMKEVMGIFQNDNVLASSGAISHNVELLFDVLHLFAVHHCCNTVSESQENEDFMCGVNHVAVSIVAKLTVSSPVTVSFGDDQEVGLTESTVGNSSLGVLSALGGYPIENIAAMLLNHVSSASQLVFCLNSENGNNSATFTSTSTSTSAAGLRRLLRFTSSFMSLAQLIMQFHTNRKKLFTSICETLLPSLLQLLSYCDNVLLGSGTTLSGERAVIVTQYFAPLSVSLRSLLMSGLFDEKTVDELASMRLQESLAVVEKTPKQKKQRVGQENSESTASSITTTATAANISKNNKAFHDILFRVLSVNYYGSEGSTVKISALAVGTLLSVYCSKSADMALQASVQDQHGFQSAGRSGSLGTDAVNARKHLLRVFHFTFLLLEALDPNVSTNSSSRDILFAALIEIINSSTTAESADKKRKSADRTASDKLPIEVHARVDSEIRRCSVRNALLDACVKAVCAKAIPNHDSLVRYVARLQGMSAVCTQDCLAIESQLLPCVAATSTASGSAGEQIKAFSQRLLALDLQCICRIASIDHNTVVGAHLGVILRVLGGVVMSEDTYDSTATTTTTTTATLTKQEVQDCALFPAGLELFKSIMNIHGELRLMDQFISEAITADNKCEGGLLKDKQETSLLTAIVQLDEIFSRLCLLLGAIPTGQGPTIWSHLARTEKKSTLSSFRIDPGVVACCLARAVMQAQLHTVRSNASVLLPHEAAIAGGSDSDKNAVSDSSYIDPITGHATVLLWKLSTVLSAVVSAQSKRGAEVSGAIVTQVLRTTSALLRFVTHSCSGAIAQLLVPVPVTGTVATHSHHLPSEEVGKSIHHINNDDDKMSLFSIAMSPILNCLVAMKVTSGSRTAVLHAALSLLLLSSNVQAKVACVAHNYSAQLQVIRNLMMEFLSCNSIESTDVRADMEEDSIQALETLVCVLRDARTWVQLGSPCSQQHIHQQQNQLCGSHLSVLFKHYIAALVNPSPELNNQSLLVQCISGLLNNASVSDSVVVREAVCDALSECWRNLHATHSPPQQKQHAQRASSSTQTQTLQKKSRFINNLSEGVPRIILLTAQFLLPSLFAHIQDVLTACKSSNLAEDVRKDLLMSADYLSAALIDHARSVQYSRVTATLSFTSTSASDFSVPVSVQMKAVCVLNCLLTSAGMKIPNMVDADEDIKCAELLRAVDSLITVILPVLQDAASCSYSCASFSDDALPLANVSKWLQLCVDTIIMHLFDLIPVDNNKQAIDVFNQLWAVVTDVVMKNAVQENLLHSPGKYFAVLSADALLRTVLNAFVARAVDGKVAKSSENAVPAAVDICMAALHKLLNALVDESTNPVPIDGSASPIKRTRAASKDPVRTTKSTSQQNTDSRFMYIAEILVAISALQSRNDSFGVSTGCVCGLRAAQITSLVRSLFSSVSSQPFHGVGDGTGGCDKDVYTRDGWLRLFGVISDTIVLQLGVVTLPGTASSDSADLRTLSAVIDLNKLYALCDALRTVVCENREQANNSGENGSASLATASLLINVLHYVLQCRACSCDASEVLSTFKTCLFTAQSRSGDKLRGLCIAKDLLIYFTEHGRRLLTSVSKDESSERYHRFHLDLTAMVCSLFQSYVATTAVRTCDDIHRMAIVIQHMNSVTQAASLTMQKLGKGGSGGARRKQQKQIMRGASDLRATVFRFDLWFDGLMNVLALTVSHMHCWITNSAAVSTTTATTTASASTAPVVAENANAATVALLRRVLEGLERVVVVSNTSALPNLNTSVGALCSLVTTCISLMLTIETRVTGDKSSCLSHVPHRAISETELGLAACCHLLCRVCGGIGSSAVLEKHIHFIASAVVEALSKTTVPRQFQELAYPGIYALFEKCQSRQKTQMFAMLDTQSRVLMTDLHNEFMRSFKFVGK